MRTGKNILTSFKIGDFYESTWIERRNHGAPRFPPSTWNHHDTIMNDGIQTNNHLESYNRTWTGLLARTLIYGQSKNCLSNRRQMLEGHSYPMLLAKTQALIRVERRGHWMTVLESSFCWVDMTPCLKKTSFSCWRMICKNDMDVRTDNIYVTDTEINVL